MVFPYVLGGNLVYKTVIIKWYEPCPNMDPKVKNKLMTGPHTSYSWKTSVGPGDSMHN